MAVRHCPIKQILPWPVIGLPVLKDRTLHGKENPALIGVSERGFIIRLQLDVVKENRVTRIEVFPIIH